MEVKSLAGASSALEKQVIEATGGQIVSPGKYHKTFFSWVISLIKDARNKIDDAGIWLQATKGKQKGMGQKAKKSSSYYKEMTKKHGNDFTLSGERGIATQNG
jgi:hypothetical protein